MESLSAEYTEFKENTATTVSEHKADLDGALRRQRQELDAAAERNIQIAKLTWESEHLTLMDDLNSQVVFPFLWLVAACSYDVIRVV